MSAVGVFPLLGEPGHPWEFGLCLELALDDHLASWGWEPGHFRNMESGWNTPYLDEEVPIQRPRVLTQHHGLWKLPVG